MVCLQAFQPLQILLHQLPYQTAHFADGGLADEAALDVVNDFEGGRSDFGGIVHGVVGELVGRIEFAHVAGLLVVDGQRAAVGEVGGLFHHDVGGVGQTGSYTFCAGFRTGGR